MKKKLCGVGGKKSRRNIGVLKINVMKESTKKRMMELANLEELTFNENEVETVKKAFGRLDSQIAQMVEDGYYALTDNLPNLINDLEGMAKELAKETPYSADEVALIKKEAKIYRQVQALIDTSLLGSAL